MKPLFSDVPVLGNKYKYGDWKLYAVHDAHSIRGFFGDYRFLGNFEGAEVYLDDLLFSNLENAYQFAKLKPFPRTQKGYMDYTRIKAQVMLMSAKESKKWGNTIDLREDWEKVKYDVMASLVFDKFYRHPKLRRQLLATDNKYLEETNHWHDNIWGNCVCPRCEKIVGKNQLGRILTKTRDFWQ